VKNLVIEALFEFVAENPPMACICGGILLLLTSPAYNAFAPWGGGLIALGAVLQVLWIFKERIPPVYSERSER
jgi:hypothetical protein